MVGGPVTESGSKKKIHRKALIKKPSVHNESECGIKSMLECDPNGPINV